MSNSSLASLTLKEAVARARGLETQSDIDSPTPALQPPPIPIRPLPHRLFDRKIVQSHHHDKEDGSLLPSQTPSRNGSTGLYNRTSLETPANTVAPPNPETPRTQRVVDQVGDEFKENLSYILGELKRALESLLPSKDQAKRSYSSLAPPLAEQGTSLTFRCERIGFRNALNMVEYCQRLANKTPTSQPSGKPENGPSTDLIIDRMNETMQKMEEKMTRTLTEHAKSVSSAIEQVRQEALASTHSQPQLSFAQATAKHAAPLQKPKSQSQTLRTGVTVPTLFSSITLAQKNRDRFVEMDTDEKYLIERINKKLKFAVDLHSTDKRPLAVNPIRGFSRNRRTGDILIQFTHQEDADAATLTHSLWVPMLDASLRLKLPSYPVIVHGIPTSFNPQNLEEVQLLQDGNQGLLDSLESIRWANRHLIELGKPFSSLIIYLKDPEEANQAIKNRISFFSTLKMVEKSVRKRSQCLKCHGYGHSTSRCTAEQNCPTCDESHKPGAVSHAS